jgi:tetratricopeptide (TPR) repeat protein
VFAAVVGLILLSLSEPEGLMTSGDAAFFRIAYPEAISMYEAALSSAPQDIRLFWRLARAYVCSAEVEEDESRRQTMLRRAEEYARRSIEADPSVSQGHTWLAAALGYKALAAGMGEQVRISRELVEATDRAIALNSSDDAAYSIRGSFFRALGNVGWFKRQLAALLLGEIPPGGFPEAEAALLTAISLAPDIMRHHYELGILYMDLGRKEEARRSLERAAALDIRTAIDRPRKEKSLMLLKTLEDEQ